MIKNSHDEGRMVGKFMSLRDVTVADAQFILELRTSEKGLKFLHYTPPDVNAQISYIESYLRKEDEWYFIIEDSAGRRVGCIGIYDIQEDSAVTGRWIMLDGLDPRIAVECKLMVNDFIYYTLGLGNIRTDTVVANKANQAVFRAWGCEKIGERDGLIYYNLTKAVYERNKPRFKRFCR